MLITKVYIILISKQVFSKLLPFSNEKSTRHSLSLCLCASSDRFFKDSDTTILSLPLHEVNKTQKSVVVLNNLLLECLFRKYQLPLMIRNLSNPNMFHYNVNILHKPANNYFVQIRNYHDIIDTVALLKNHLWNSHAKFIIYSPTIFERPIEIVREIINTLWMENVLNGIVLLANDKNRTKFNVHAWFPFKNGNCGTNLTSIATLDTCNFGVFENGTNWFPDKIPKKFSGCPIRVGYKNAPPFTVHLKNFTKSTTNKYGDTNGIEVNIANTIAEFYNLTMIYYMEEAVGTIYENGTIISGLLAKLNEDIYDMALGGLVTDQIRCILFDYTKIYIQTPLTWCTPHDPIKQQFINHLIAIFDWKTWILILLAFFVLSHLISYFSCKTIQETSNTKELSNVYLNNFGCLIATSVNMLPNTTFVRYLTVFMLFLSFYIDSAYITYMTSVLSNPKILEKYNTMDDIFNSNLKTFYMENADKYLSDIFIKRPNLKHRRKICINNFKCVLNVAFTRQSAVCGNGYMVNYVGDKLIDVNKRKMLNCFKKVIVNLPGNLYFRKGFPIHHHFNDILVRLIEAGLIGKWLNDVFQNKEINEYTQYLKAPENHLVSDSSNVTVALFSDLSPIFLLLIFGQMFAFVVFLIEILVNRFKNK